MPITTGPGPDDRHAFYAVSSFEGVGPGDLAGLGVDFALPDSFGLDVPAWTISADPVEPGDEDVPVADTTGFETAMAEAGVRVGGDLPDGTVSIRDGADVAVVLNTVS